MEPGLEPFYELVLSVQTEPHGPEDLRPVLTQVIEGVQEFRQVGVAVHHIGSEHVVVVTGSLREALFQLLPPGQLSDTRSVSTGTPGVTQYVILQVTQHLRQVCGRDLGT